MTDSIALAVSALALAVSATTAWLTLFRRGTVRMTQPTTIFFGPDTPRFGERDANPKIYLRTLLFATSKRGRIIESMHVSLFRSETQQNFNIWVYGETSKLVRGSGLFVGETGVAANHHFLTPDDGSHFKWLAGHYQLSVYARLVGDKAHKLLFSQALEVTPSLAGQLDKPGIGLYFDWGPDSSRYLPHIEQRPTMHDHEQFIETLDLTSRAGR
ncbi:hypothetical protein [Paraburkholderia terricola]|uniref:Uncharacterized protein n=1 Tax=Paraburkholderia terricola TaxID=169427 RepID=A0A1M6JLK4_9BURK|nr:MULTISPECIES: hypothetical protein [Paraburkholderia]SDN63590.1 hypothetical protein SAMN05192547_1002188 [Paraburkholderia sediminicola]SHJ47542.1 hypothetical protein SAMN05192548_1002188 [Paraburkholderia terricola]